jgi:hypothetical protein
MGLSFSSWYQTTAGNVILRGDIIIGISLIVIKLQAKTDAKAKRLVILL